MEFVTTYRKLLLSTLAAVLFAVLHGCVTEDVDVQDTEGSRFMMSVTVITNSSMGTRAGHTDDNEEVGSAAENYIDFDGNDFKIVLFDSEGKYVMELDTDNRWMSYPGSSDNTVHYLEGELEFPESVSEATIDDIKKNGLQVMALANWEKAGGTYNGLFAGGTDGHQRLSEIWEDKGHYNFRYLPETDNGWTWRPDLEDAPKKLIPMFGYAEAGPFVLSGNVFYSNTTILMQRALAKIEVIDNLQLEGISLEDVTMTEYNGQGRFIPNVKENPDWNKTGSQVGTSSLPATPDKQTPTDGLKFFHDAASKTWIAYVPEMQLASAGVKEVSDSRTHLNVKVKGELEGIYEGSTTYPLHFARYDQNYMPTIPDESWNHILRNHIYRFSVINVGITAELELQVKPWELDEDEAWDYTDHVTVGQMLKWTDNSYESLDENGRLLLWIDDKRPLEGSFMISTPTNGRWYARLTPLDDANPNAITFVDLNGNTMEPSQGEPSVCHEISGTIKSETTRIWIKPTNFGNEKMSAFRLEFFVENLGMLIKVPMVEDGVEYDCFTIVRKDNQLN